MSVRASIDKETLRASFIVRRALQDVREGYARDVLQHLDKQEHLCNTDPLLPSDLFRALLLDEGWPVNRGAAVYFAVCTVLRTHGVQL